MVDVDVDIVDVVDDVTVFDVTGVVSFEAGPTDALDAGCEDDVDVLWTDETVLWVVKGALAIVAAAGVEGATDFAVVAWLGVVVVGVVPGTGLE